MSVPAIAPPASHEEAFKRGQACLERRTYQEAASYFQFAIDMERTVQKNTNVKYLSFLGLALNCAQGRSEEGLRMCEQAAKREFFDADIFCNLGIVYLRNRQRGPAFAAFQRGLALRPKHRRILDELSRYERRSSPVLPFLARDHALNIVFGRLRARLSRLLGRFATSEA
jgi:tetratricopeptide (TPR) repeat protein